MLAETEDAEGTGQGRHGGAGLSICGKTGTAQVEDERNQHDRLQFLVRVLRAV